MRISLASSARTDAGKKANARRRVQNRPTTGPRNGPYLVRTSGRKRCSVLEHLREKLLRPLALRGREELRAGRLLHDAALVHEDHAVRDLAGEPHLVGDDH